jgi:hypothetical protein
LEIPGNLDLSKIDASMVSPQMVEAARSAPTGKTVAWGIPFKIDRQIIYLKHKPYTISINPLSARWIIFMHTSDRKNLPRTSDGFYEKPLRGVGLLNDEIARYIVSYEDGTEVILPIRQRYHIGMFGQDWGENCIESVASHKPAPVSFQGELTMNRWGEIQTRVSSEDRAPWINWLWAWQNPNPGKQIKGFRFEPLNKSPLVISAISFGNVSSNPLRWNSRKKILLSPSKGSGLNPFPGEKGVLTNIQLDLGRTRSTSIYPQSDWMQSYNNKIPEYSEDQIILEYSAHPEAMFHLTGQEPVPVAGLTDNQKGSIGMSAIKPADKVVKIKVFEKGSGKMVPVKFHAHGESGEYLVPLDRHRQPNIEWFQDYSADYVNEGRHVCTYINGETVIRLPLGKVYIEVSKGLVPGPCN